MFVIPTALAAVLERSHTAVSRLIVKWPDGSTRRTFDLTDRVAMEGDVTYDWRRDVRRFASLVLANNRGDLSPSLVDDLFAKSSRVALYRGALVGDQPSYVPLIDGVVASCISEMNGRLTLSLEGMLSLADQPMGESAVFSAGTFCSDVVRSILAPVLPFTELVLDDGGRALGSDLPVVVDDIRLTVVLRIVRELGLELYDDRVGRVVLRPRSDPMTAPTIRTFATPIELARTVVLAPVNAQAVEATPGEGEPIYVVATVDDQASPIHRDKVGLRMGDVFRSDSIPDPVTAMAVARQVLAGRALSQDGVSSSEAPVLDVDETDICEWAESLTKAVGRYRVDQITIPALQGTTTVAATAVIPLWVAELEESQ